MSTDNSVKIYPKGNGRSFVEFELSDVVIEKIFKEAQEVTGEAMGLDFASLVNNAVIEYLKSPEWADTKEYMQEQNELED